MHGSCFLCNHNYVALAVPQPAIFTSFSDGCCICSLMKVKVKRARANGDSKGKRARDSSTDIKFTVCGEIGVPASYMFLLVLLLMAVQSSGSRKKTFLFFFFYDIDNFPTGVKNTHTQQLSLTRQHSDTCCKCGETVVIV